MGFLTALFERSGKRREKAPLPKAEQCIRLAEFQARMGELEKSGHYIARSEYRSIVQEYRATADFFTVLADSGMLKAFCGKNGICQEEAEAALDKLLHLNNYIDERNEQFVEDELVKEKEYLDHILDAVDPSIQLDENQRRVILTDEDYCLVVAGAGAGKTTTVAAKVKYLVEKKAIDPAQILVISFTNKAVNELRERINTALQIGCPIATFHSTGNAIIHKNSPEEKLNIVENSKMYFVIRDYFRTSVLKNDILVNKLIMFFASYFDAPYEGDDLNAFFNEIAKANFSTMRSELEDFKREVMDSRTKRSVTIQNEVLRSRQEVEIANFLYLNNISYEYEPAYQYHILYARKPYTPDFIIWQGEKAAYIEHFGITEAGENDRYSQDELNTYKRAVRNKIELHKKHGTELLYTFSRYKDGRSVTQHLQEQMEKAGFELHPRSNKEIMELLVAGEENRYIRRLLSLICRFISNFKVNGYTMDEFDRMYHTTQNVRTRLFLDICQESFLQYEKYLKENKAVDFQDMINESARILREVKEMKQTLDFKYIIVDEYQDISRQRFDLTKALAEVTDAKIIAVGDDWQSIYAFSGSDITLFTKFEEKMGYAKLLKIVNTYRNSQEVIDIAGNFIQKNQTQIEKSLKSPKRITDPVIIYTYDCVYKERDGNRRSGVNYAMAYAVQIALDQIVEYAAKERKPAGAVLFLGRFGFDVDQLERSGMFEAPRRGNKVKSVKYPKMDITFMTAHSSKGLGYDNVIILNGKNETYGFPSKIEDDPVLNFVVHRDHSIDYAEERRLFYVAMTRTKNRVYFIAPQKNPSEFLLELKHDYKNIILRGNWNEKVSESPGRKRCPICGYPLQYKYKNAYGLPLFICTNEPEICSFMTNNYSGGKLSIMKCEQCRDGYLIIKPGSRGDYFLGCTNYRADGKGCGNVISKNKFYEMMGYSADVDAEAAKAKPELKREPDDQKVEGRGIASENVQYKEEQLEISAADIGSVVYKGWELNRVAYTMVSALQHISHVRYYGAATLLDVLKGEETERIITKKLNALPEYGALKEMQREDLYAVLDWLLKNHFMLKTRESYPVLHPTYDGMHYRETMTTAKLRKLKKYLDMEEKS